MKRSLLRLATPLLAAAMLCLAPQSAKAVPVSTELSLLLDVSGSVSTTEFELQRTGYVNAFNSPGIQALIAAAPGGIAVNMVMWSGTGQQTQVVAWQHLTNAATSSAFAASVAAVVRPFAGNTAPGSALNFATPLFTSNGFEGARLVIDVSGDGAENEGANTFAARNAALAAGINQINGLPILGEAGLLAFYQNNIQGGEAPSRYLRTVSQTSTPPLTPSCSANWGVKCRSPAASCWRAPACSA